jgi:hypothetical protein
LAGINAAVVGVLGAALYNPIWLSAVGNGRDVAIALVGFLLLERWRVPPLASATPCQCSSLHGLALLGGIHASCTANNGKRPLQVHDVDAAIAWYTKHLGFTVLSNAAPAFADVTLGSLRLLLSGPSSSAGRPMPDGARPEAGGWNRVHLIVDDHPGEVARLRAAGVAMTS